MTYQGSREMVCMSCFRVYPWWPPNERRRWFPSPVYAECWSCAYRHHRPRLEPWWWRLAARLFRVDWR